MDAIRKIIKSQISAEKRNKKIKINRFQHPHALYPEDSKSHSCKKKTKQNKNKHTHTHTYAHPYQLHAMIRSTYLQWNRGHALILFQSKASNIYKSCKKSSKAR